MHSMLLGTADLEQDVETLTSVSRDQMRPEGRTQMPQKAKSKGPEKGSKGDGKGKKGKKGDSKGSKGGTGTPAAVAAAASTVTITEVEGKQAQKTWQSFCKFCDKALPSLNTFLKLSVPILADRKSVV